jgi:uncharacterized membrane protein (DUF485 family)
MGNERGVLILEAEKSKLNREKCRVVLDKSLLLYFSFIFVAVIGLVNGYLKLHVFNLVVGMGLVVLVVGLVPYVLTMKKEEKKLDELISEMRGRRGGKQ